MSLNLGLSPKVIKTLLKEGAKAEQQAEAVEALKARYPFLLVSTSAVRSGARLKLKTVLADTQEYEAEAAAEGKGIGDAFYTYTLVSVDYVLGKLSNEKRSPRVVNPISQRALSDDGRVGRKLKLLLDGEHGEALGLHLLTLCIVYVAEPEFATGLPVTPVEQIDFFDALGKLAAGEGAGPKGWAHYAEAADEYRGNDTIMEAARRRLSTPQKPEAPERLRPASASPASSWHPEARDILRRMLMAMFNSDEIRSLLAFEIPGGREYAANMPGRLAAPAAVVTAFVEQIEAGGLLEPMFRAAVQCRPNRYDEVRAVADLFGMEHAVHRPSPRRW